MDIKLIFSLFFIFSVPISSNVEAKVESISSSSFSKTESIEKIFFKAVDITKNVKQNKRRQRKLFKRWNKSNRKKLGLGAGLLSMFSLVAWRRRLKKRKKKRRRSNSSDDDGCAKILGVVMGLALASLLGRWLIKALFGVMVNFWTGALLGFLALGLLVLIAIFFAKAANGEF